jgi:hypothetical protein
VKTVTTYESFSELAKAMTDGGGVLHLHNCAQHGNINPCISWQSGVMDFADWLDHIGVKVEACDTAGDFYAFVSKRYSDPYYAGDKAKNTD